MLKAASTSRGPSLSKAWEVTKAHKGAYSGGKVELSKDGTFVACLYEADVSFLNIEEGVVINRLRREDGPGAEEEIVSFTLHPNGSEIVTVSRNNLLRHWDIETGECKRAIKAHDHTVLCMDYDVSGTLVATGSSDQTIKVWDIERGYCTHNFRGHTGIVSVVVFHPDPKRLALVSGSEDTTVRVWNLTKQSCVAVLKAHLSYVTSVAFLPGGDTLVSGGRDRVLNVWNLDSPDVLKTVPVYEEVEGLQVVPQGSEEFSGNFPVNSGSLVAVAGKNGVVRVFAVEGNQALTTSDADGRGREKKRKSATASPSSRSASLSDKLTCRCVMTQDNGSASHKAGYTALLLDRRRGGLIGVTTDHNLLLLEAQASHPDGSSSSSLVTRRQIVGYNDEVIDIKSLPRGVSGGGDDAESWVAVATNSPQVRLFELGGFSCRLLDGHTDTVLALDAAPDGRHLCTSSKDRTCLLWDLELGIPVVRWSGHADAVGAVAASRKPGPWASTASSSAGGAFVVSGAADRTLQRWDIPCRALTSLEQTARESRGLATAAFEAGGSTDEGGSAKGKAGKAAVGRWKPPAPLLETARRNVRAHEKDINCVAVSPNDMVVASASQDRTVKLWRAADLELMGVLKGHKRGVWKVEFSPVDRCVATCSGDRTVKLWSITDYACLRTFQGHTASVLSVAFVSAGAQIVSGGADGLVKVWTIRSDECEATLDAHTDKVWALATATTPRRARGDDDDDDEAEEDRNGALVLGEAGPNAGLVVVSGGADSVINVWKDVTAREEEKIIAEKEAGLLKEQQLYNCLRNKDFGPAIALALELKRSQRLWSVLRDAMTDGMGESAAGAADDGDEATAEMSSRRLDEYVASWSMDTIAQCLGYCRDWNTNARKSVVVHALLGSILRRVSVASLKELPGCAELVRILLPYSERHFQRLDRLLQSSYLVEHTLASMQMLIGGEEGDEARNLGPRASRPLVRELKRLRDGQRDVGGTPPTKESERGVIGMISDSGSSDDSDTEDREVLPVPISEVVDGHTVFNVRVDPEGGRSDSDDDDDDAAAGVGVVMGEVYDGIAVKGGISKTGKGDKAVGVEDGDDGSARKAKKKRKKRARDKDDTVGTSVERPLGLVGQEEVIDSSLGTTESEEAVIGVPNGDIPTAAGSGKKGRKKRRRSSPAVIADDTTASEVVSGEVDPAAVVSEAGAGDDGETGGEQSGKKKKKRSGKGRRKSSAM